MLANGEYDAGDAEMLLQALGFEKLNEHLSSVFAQYFNDYYLKTRGTKDRIKSLIRTTKESYAQAPALANEIKESEANIVYESRICRFETAARSINLKEKLRNGVSLEQLAKEGASKKSVSDDLY